MKRKSQRLWDKAEQDFMAAQRLDVEELPSIIAFHVQQGLEKIFKVCLVEMGLRPPIAHDLVALWTLTNGQTGIEINPVFLVLLNEFAVDIRYDEDATPEQAKLALEEALKIRAAILVWLETISGT
jgi:HEPN domain-containing protein